MLADRARHVVVEANPALVPLLMQNRDLNGCRFAVLNRAVAHGAPVMEFHVADDVLSSSLHVPGRQSVAVPTTTLRGVLDEQQFERCTVICDIEGAELELVEHESDTLSSRVAMLIVELHDRLVGPAQASRIRKMLDDAGFEPVDRVWETIAFRNRRF
jgi:FkbM family methyltransferase